MTGIPQDIHEIDLMAYADGLLESDAGRKAVVEAYLEANPGEAARVAAIVEDNRAIRNLYAAELHRPVPLRLLRTVREPARTRLRMPAAIAASLMLSVLAAGGGWLIGQGGGDSASVPADLLRNIAGHHTDASLQTAMHTPANGTLLSDLSRKVLIEVPAPDLGGYGFDLAGRSLVEVGGQKMMRLVYRSSDVTMNLFMRLRRNAKTTAMQDIQADGMSVYYWSAGPLAYAMTVEAEDGRAASLARAIRGAIKPGHFIEQSPANTAGPGESVAGDDTGGIGQPVEQAPPRPQPSRFN